MLNGVACQALTFDSRVLPCSIVLPHADRLEREIDICIAEILGTRTGIPLPAPDASTIKTQLGLPTHSAGLQVPYPSITTPLARTAALFEGGPLLRSAILRWTGKATPTLYPCIPTSTTYSSTGKRA